MPIFKIISTRFFAIVDNKTLVTLC